MANKEIEIQVEIEKINPLIAFLEKEGEFLYEDHQLDEYYTPAHRNFADLDPINEWLRLRDSNGKFSITYKNWHRDENKKAYHCDEFESGLESFEQVEKILNILDFKTVVGVEKNRSAYKYLDYEIAIDKVKNLGTFVEVEFKGENNKDHNEIVQDMIKFLKSLELGKLKRNSVGYAYKLLYPDRTEYLEDEL